MKMPESPPDLGPIVQGLKGTELLRAIQASGPVDARGRYLHWDDMRSRTPPKGLTHQEWWLGARLSRSSIARAMPLRSTQGGYFTFSNIDAIQGCVHRIDQVAGGQILADDLVTNLRSSDRYLVSSLTEEAITSSQLEGASTTRKVAKELLATGRQPRDKSEHMIVNNYQAMLFAQEVADLPLTPELVLNFHRIITDGTLDDPKDAGRLQTPADERIAVIWDTNRPEELILHRPPDASELPERLEALCEFANGEGMEGFVHPVARAIMLHFWLSYDHPFVDGNGRTARALFYWLMLREGYWLAQYISVSSILRKAPAQYVRSYLLAESDNNDVTYFVVDQLQVLERAIMSLHDYLARKISETREIEQMLRGSAVLNHRQLVIVRDTLRDPAEPFTIAAQARRLSVTYESARSDLLGLEDLGLFGKERVGKKHVFRPRPALAKKLRDLGATSGRVA